MDLRDRLITTMPSQALCKMRDITSLQQASEGRMAIRGRLEAESSAVKSLLPMHSQGSMGRRIAALSISPRSAYLIVSILEEYRRNLAKFLLRLLPRMHLRW